MLKIMYPLLALALIAGVSGCAGLKEAWRPIQTDMTAWIPGSSEKDSDSGDSNQTETEGAESDGADSEGFGKPVKIAVTWKETIYQRPGAPTIQGFGGRVFFYDKDDNAIRVEGELTIFGFDESNEQEESNRVADKKFITRSSELQSHYSESGIGPSYSVWVPWKKMGGLRKAISLISVFRLADGTMLSSDPVINSLAGKNPELQRGQAGEQGSNRPNSGFSQRIHKPLTSENSEQNAANRTSTIRVPRGLAQQMANAPVKDRSEPIAGDALNRKAEQAELSETPNSVGGRAVSTSEQASPGNQSLVETPQNRADTQSLPEKSKRWAFGVPGRFK